jgi:nucleoside-diphosphate-sugar epimerase
MKKILILGSGGQIGSHLSIYLEKKYKVLKFDLANDNSEDLRIDYNVKFISLVKQSDFIFFLAFDVGGSRYLKKYQNSYNFLMNNVSIMKNTFQVIKRFKKRFIFASSQMSNMSFSTYGVLKKIGEDITKSIGGISVRFWNVYGIEKDIEKSHVITDFILKAIKNNKINMLTNGNEKRDFLYADDCCHGLLIVMKKYKILKRQEIIDLNYGFYTKIINVAKIVRNIFKERGIVIKIIKGRHIDEVQKNKMNKSNNLLIKYWKPRITLKNGIQKIFQYHFFKKN